jgi:hypothetical protein
MREPGVHNRRVTPSRPVVVYRTLVAALVVAAIAAGCEPSASPLSPTEPPLKAPTIQFDRYTATNGVWTFYATVNPGGSPTEVVLETGVGTEDAPVFDDRVPVASDMLSSGQVTAVVEYPEDVAFCVRFTARNEVGTTSTAPRCPAAIVLPTHLVVPSPS